MESILYSVHFDYVHLMLNRLKMGEYRTKLPKNEFNTIYIYATKIRKTKFNQFRDHSQKIVAKALVHSIHSLEPSKLWDKTNQIGGVTKTQFDNYFKGREVGHFIRFQSFQSFTPIDPSLIVEGFTAPQTYMYLQELQIQKLDGMISNSTIHY